MNRRLGPAVLAALTVLLGPAVPARAVEKLAVTVAEVAPDQVRLVADVPQAADARIPPIAVARDGRLLPSVVEAGQGGSARTVVVVLDTGAAMAGAPLRAAQAGVLAFAERVPADVAIGLVAAAGEPAVLVPPTRNRGELRAGLSALRASGGTAVYAGLRAAAELVTESSDARLLVVAGGRDATGGPAPMLPDLTAARVRVDLVDVRPVPAQLTELRRLVTATGGTARSATSPAAVSGALRSAAAAVPLRVTITVAVPPELAGTTGILAVTAGTGATAAQGSVTVRFAAMTPATSSGSSPGAAGPAFPRLPTLPRWVLAVLVFGVLLTCILLVVLSLTGSVAQRRLRQVERFRLTTSGARAGRRDVRPGPQGGFARAAVGGSDRSGGPRAGNERGASEVEGGDPPAGSPAWATGAGTALAGAVLLGLLGGVLGVLLGAALGGLSPWLYGRVRESRRRQSFAEQLPDALQLVVGSLRSGFSLAQAMDAVVQDSPSGPLTVELGRAMAEVRLGSDLDDALERVAHRVGNDDLAWAVMAIRIQRDTGGNLAEVLETTVETLRERDRLRRHVRALSAEGRLSAYVLIALPIVMAVFMLLTRREYLSPLWTTPAGLTMLVGAGVLMVVGIFWMARWIRVEV